MLWRFCRSRNWREPGSSCSQISFTSLVLSPNPWANSLADPAGLGKKILVGVC
jgi:hypothetical protein